MRCHLKTNQPLVCQYSVILRTTSSTISDTNAIRHLSKGKGAQLKPLPLNYELAVLVTVHERKCGRDRKVHPNACSYL